MDKGAEEPYHIIFESEVSELNHKNISKYHFHWKKSGKWLIPELGQRKYEGNPGISL